VAERVIEGLPFDEDEKPRLSGDLRLAILFHDLGKAALGFQEMLRGQRPGWDGLRHEILSASLASSVPGLSPEVLLAVLTHHRTLPSNGVEVEPGQLPWEQLPLDAGSPEPFARMAREVQENDPAWRACWKELREIAQEFDLPATLAPVALGLDLRWLVRGTHAASQRRSFRADQRLRAALLRGLLVTCDHMASAHVDPPPPVDLKRIDVAPVQPRGFQQRAAEVHGHLLLRAPTGSGKTEAVLMWAQANQARSGRVYYVLPHTASIDAMRQRLGEHKPDCPSGCRRHFPVGILHARAAESIYGLREGPDDLSARLGQQAIAKQVATLAREMGFTFRVCTPHQILRHALRGKGWELALAEFQGALFIFDEVHAYEPRIAGLVLATARLVERWGGRCAFVSATLPAFLERLIRAVLPGIGPTVVPSEIDATDREVLLRARHRVVHRPGTVADLSASELRWSAATLVACNHVRTAQETYKRLRGQLASEASIMLLHGRFNRRDRVHKEQALTRGGPLPTVLVATQVVEVSLDIDFERLVTEPAPIDALIQRMGRVNRSGAQASPATVKVLERQWSEHPLYPHDLVRRSVAELIEAGERGPLSEADLLRRADRVYGTGYAGDEQTELVAGLSHPGLAEFDDRAVAGAHEDWVESVIESADSSIDVLPDCLEAEYRDLMAKGLWLEANALLVPVRWRALRSRKYGLRHDRDNGIWVIDAPYTSELGLRL
jgi:CRISPR-associated endonuclease/helicase Cas3